MQYRIFVSAPGNYNTPDKCVFVAAFPERKAAVNYVQYMFGKKRYAGKDVVVRKAADYEVDPGEGIIDGVVTALGEELIFENGVLVD